MVWNFQRSKKMVSVGNTNEYWNEVEDECQAMLKHCFSMGENVPVTVSETLEELLLENPDNFDESGVQVETKLPRRAKRLTEIHNTLAKIIAPASPKTVLLIAREEIKGKVMLFLGPVPLIRRLMVMAILSLFGLISLSLSEEVNNVNMALSMFENDGLVLFKIQTILLASAGLGASFAGLFRANKYIVDGTFDPKYETSYWVRFVVGLMAGIIITQLIPIDMTGLSETMAGDGTLESRNEEQTGFAMMKITMALLGGFSADLVYKILNRLVETVQSFISPPPPPLDPKQFQEAAGIEYEKQILQAKSDNAQALTTMQQQLLQPENVNPEKIMEITGQLIAKLNDKPPE